MKKWSLFIVFAAFTFFYSCKSNNKQSSAANGNTPTQNEKSIANEGPITAESMAKNKSTYQPKDGYSPVSYGVSLDPMKEEKVKQMLGTDVYEKVDAVKMTKELNDQWNEQARQLIKSRKEQDGDRVNEVLVSDYWVIGGVFKDTMGNPQVYAGRWIKFNRDDTYEYGNYTEPMGKGTYHYLLGNDILIMVDSDPAVKPLEFEVGFEKGYMIFFGSKSYDDRDLQIKLDKYKAKPTK